MGDKHIELLETPLIKQKLNALTGSHFTFLVLGINSFLSTSELSFSAHVDQLSDFILIIHNFLEKVFQLWLFGAKFSKNTKS